MLHFFRKIRRELLAKNNFFRYLKYGIGEIILVVLGILIALYINNQNEQRKEQERFDMVLVDVEKELIDNISMTREVIDRLAYADSLYLKFFVDSLKFENVRNYGNIIGNIGGLKTPQDDFFQKLTEINDLSIEQDSILDELIALYRAEINLDMIAEEILNTARTSHETFKEYHWFESYLSGRFDDVRMINYFENNQEYRNLAGDLFRLNYGYRFQLSLYDNLAVPVYKKIHKYLDSLNIKRSDSLILDYEPNDYKHYVGKYDFKWGSHSDEVTDSVFINIKNDKLYWTDYVSGEIDWNFEIIPINQYRFRLKGQAVIGHLEIDTHEEVLGLRMDLGPIFYTRWEKIR